MAARILTAIVGIPAIIVLATTGGKLFFFLVVLLSLLGLAEYYRLTQACLQLKVWGYVAATVLLLDVYLAWGSAFEVGGMSFLIALLVIILVSFPHITFAQAGSAVLGVMYIPYLFSYLIRLRALSFGAAFTVLVFILTWVSDSAAFLVGSRWGRNRLAPLVSPKKTWEGAVAGLAGTVLTMLAVHKWFGMTPALAIGLGAVVGFFAELGDLIESVLKRQAGVKDSGNLLPGHGGILDRFDALLLAAPVMYAWLHLWL